MKYITVGYMVKYNNGIFIFHFVSYNNIYNKQHSSALKGG